MGDESAASTLSLVAGILQVIFSLIFIVFGIVLVGIMILPLIYDPYLMSLMWPIMLIPFLIFGVIGVVGLIFALLWLGWRHNPNEHKTGLIVSGILALFFSIGFIPGILAVIAGAIAPFPTEYSTYQPTPKPTYQTVMRCPSCNANINPDDRFCWRCGQSL